MKGTLNENSAHPTKMIFARSNVLNISPLYLHSPIVHILKKYILCIFNISVHISLTTSKFYLITFANFVEYF